MRRRRPPGGCRVGAEDQVDAEAAVIKNATPVLRTTDFAIATSEYWTGVRFVFRADRQIAKHRGRIGKGQQMVAAPKIHRQQ